MEKQKKTSTPYDKIRKPVAPPSQKHGKDKYDRKEKHKKKIED